MRCAAVCFFAVSLALAQTDRQEKVPETTFRIGTDLVVLNVSVFDQSWQVIKGLPQTAFTVYENNVKQEVSVFRQEDVAVSLGLIIDNSASMEKKRDRVASAALAMVKASNPDDEVFIVNFNEEADIVQDFTRDAAVLEKSLRGFHSQGDTAMRDAALLGIDHLRKGVKDKRVLVVITDGEDNSSISTQQRVVEAAHLSGAIIYAIGLAGGESAESAARAKKQLEALTSATGGRAWFLPDVAAIAAVTPEIAHEIRNQYVLGFTSSDPNKDGKFRALRVEVNVPGATVRTRSGYYARP